MRRQLIAFAIQREVLDGREVAAEQQRGRPPRGRRERDDERPRGVGEVLAVSDPGARVRSWTSRLVDDRDVMTGASDPHHLAQPSLLDHGAARHPVSDQIDDVGAGAHTHRELDPTADPTHRRLAELEDDLVTRSEAIEIEVGAHGALLVLEVRERVDPEHLHDELGHMLDVGLEHDRLVDPEPRRIVQAPRQLDPFAQRCRTCRSECERGAIGVASPEQQTCGRDLGIEPAAIEPACERLRRIELGGQQLAHQLLVIAGWWQPGHRAEVVAELRHIVAADTIDPVAGQIVRRAGELEISREQLRIGRRSELSAGIEQVPQDVRLERVDRGRKVRDERPQRQEVRVASLAVELEIDVRAQRDHALDHRGHPAEVPRQLGMMRGERQQLLVRQLVVNGE
ncbi:MAG: hypothetical protein JWP01_2104 [Myxococcales bacterium]|nr:hypothetical protein [Myxococcales bacterium]